MYKTEPRNPETITPPAWTGPYPEPRVRRRPVDSSMEKEALAQGLSPVVARVIASRNLADGSDIGTFLRANPSDLDPPSLLKGVDRAAERIADAIVNKEVIVLVGDKDADGTSSIALTYSIILSFNHPKDRLIPLVGNRFTDGYGISDTIAERIIAHPAKVSLAVSMDCGSSDEARIARLAEKGIDVVVTDHHEVPAAGPPKTAVATVNPNQPGCKFPDKNIAGCHTVWLVMAAVRQELIKRGHLSREFPALSQYYDFITLSTIADCVSIASKNNRIAIRAGLKRINAGSRPAWQAIRPYLIKKSKRQINAEHIAFGLAPRINSPGRIEDPMRAVKFLLADNVKEASKLAGILDSQNLERRDLERKLKDLGLAEACEQVAEGRMGLSVFMAEGHIGISGLVASRIVETFGRPAIVFARTQDENILTGSARSIEALHIRDLLQDIHEKYPDLIAKFGGHAMAAGLGVDVNNADLFMRAFDMAVRKRLKPEDVGPVILTDGPLAPEELSLGTVDALSILEPFGRKFEAPRFEGEFHVLEARPIGEDKTHLQMLLRPKDNENRPFIKAIWFRARNDASKPMPVDHDDTLYAVYELADDDYSGQRKVLLKVAHGRCIARHAPKQTRRYI